jgi:hypothetical protein
MAAFGLFSGQQQRMQQIGPADQAAQPTIGDHKHSANTMLFHKLRDMGGSGIGFYGHQLFGHDIARLGAMGAGVMLRAPGRVEREAMKRRTIHQRRLMH